MADQPDTSTRASESKPVDGESVAQPLDLDAVREAAQEARFYKLYAHWLRARAVVMDPAAGSAPGQLEAEADLARELAVMPAPLARDVLVKCDVLRACLGPDHADKREIVILAGIEADLMRILA